MYAGLFFIEVTCQRQIGHEKWNCTQIMLQNMLTHTHSQSDSEPTFKVQNPIHLGQSNTMSDVAFWQIIHGQLPPIQYTILRNETLSAIN